MIEWPKQPTMWMGREPGELRISVPFTWNLPTVYSFLRQRATFWRTAVVGGPAVDLMPEFLGLQIPNVKVMPGGRDPEALSRVNPLATRTTEGCIRSCRFCGIGQGKIEPGGFRELEDWKDLPIILDNNLLAASQAHFDKVMDRLEKHSNGVYFNQGLDARLLHPYHAERFARLHAPAIRVPCDSRKDYPAWLRAIEILREKGCRRRWISSFALIGFDSSPEESRILCESMNLHSTCMPVWYHPLDSLDWNAITKEQVLLGWTPRERTKLMRRFYQAKYGGF